jgi:hypothetical protein
MPLLHQKQDACMPPSRAKRLSPLSRMRITGVVTILLLMALFLPHMAKAQWSSMPGEQVRNAFGISQGQLARTCRGACGPDCPNSCTASIHFECVGTENLRRVRSYTCGTHQGCREHDDCLDRCSQQRAQGFDCESQCHAEAVTDFGLGQAASWAAGAGPFDGEVLYEYTRDAPDAPEAAYRCPAGASLECGQETGQCIDDGVAVAPIFDSYPESSADALRVAGFRSGRVCHDGANPSGVCETVVDIQVNGSEQCPRGGASAPCTWYGFEFDYQNADPAQPLVCSSSGASEDFLGSMVAGVLRAAPATEGTELGNLLGHFQQELQRGASLTEMFSGITLQQHGAGGVTLGTPPESKPELAPGVPRNVALEQQSGRLLVPMYEWRDGSTPGSVLVREVRCVHKGLPVLETTFRLHFASG